MKKGILGTHVVMQVGLLVNDIENDPRFASAIATFPNGSSMMKSSSI